MTAEPTPHVPWPEVLLAALVAALHAVVLLGRLHPDEVFQSLEPALFRAQGFGVMSWEWQVGLRNQAVPIFFSWLLTLGSALRLDDVLARRLMLELPQYALHAAMLASVWRLSARRLGAGLARWCLWLTALYAPLVWFGGRTMSESFSVAFLVWGLERLDAADGDRRWHLPFIGGALMGLAEVARYGSAAVIAPAMLFLLATRRWRPFAWATGGGLLVGLLLGVLDLVTWGDWFHSLKAYVNFNLVSGQAVQQFGASPWWYYLPRLAVAPWAAVGFFAWRRVRVARLWLFVFAAVGYFVAISATPHKEARFLYPTLVLLSVAGTPAFVAWVAERRRTTWVRALAAVALVGGAIFFVVPNPLAPQRKEQFQLEVKASRGATGLVLMNEGLWGTGGFFYLGANVPWCACDFPADACFQLAAHDQRFNRGLYWSNHNDAERPRDAAAIAAFEAAGFHVVERRGQATSFAR